MSTDLAVLIVPKTVADEQAALLATLQAQGFPATSWADGSAPKALVRADAEALADLSSAVAAIARGGFLDTSTGAWLTLLAKQRFNLDRKPATSMQRTVKLTAAGGAGPYTITAGQLWVATATGLKFTNIAGGTLTLGGTLDLTFQAEKPGAIYNSVGVGAMAILITSLTGVTVVDHASPPVSVSGTDEEDDVSLVARCRDRWATLGTGATAAAYRSWVLAASSEITKASVSAAAGTGDVTITVGSDAGVVSSPGVTAAQAYVAARQPLTDNATVVSATGSAITVTATLYGPATFQTAALAAAEANLAALIKATAIGGTVYWSAIVEALMEPDGVVNAVVTVPAAGVDTVLAAGQIATLAGTRTWTNT